MKAQQTVFDFLNNMLGRSTLLTVAGELVPFSGDSYNNSRFLSQLLFWADDREDWEAIPAKQWKDVAKLTRYSVDKARNFFTRMGILETKVIKNIEGNPMVHYRLNFKMLMSKLKEFFKDKVKDIIMSGFAEISKTFCRQTKNDLSARPKLQYNKIYNEKSIGQANNDVGRINKNETREQRKARLEKLYL